MAERRPFDDPDAPPTEEELRAAARLRDEGDPLVDALRAAWAPDAPAPAEHDALVGELTELAPTSGELAAAAALRDGGLAADPLVVALRAAVSPAAIEGTEHDALVTRALARVPATNVVALRFRRVALTATTVLSLAASVIVWFGNLRPDAEQDVPLAARRSTAALFDEPFHAGETSARIDRIATARAADYRDNQLRRWGAR